MMNIINRIFNNKKDIMSLENEINKIIPVIKNELEWAINVGYVGVIVLQSKNDFVTRSNVNAKIEILGYLDKNIKYKNHILIHEYMHYLQQIGLNIEEIYNYNNEIYKMEKFFNLENCNDIYNELKNNVNKCLKICPGDLKIENDEGYIIESKWKDDTDDNRELIANFGGILYLDKGFAEENFPIATKRFIELLNIGYYGKDAKKIFRGVL